MLKYSNIKLYIIVKNIRFNIVNYKIKSNDKRTEFIILCLWSNHNFIFEYPILIKFEFHRIIKN